MKKGCPDMDERIYKLGEGNFPNLFNHGFTLKDTMSQIYPKGTMSRIAPIKHIKKSVKICVIVS
ncbi:MAG: hypothetical protein KJ638_13125, partial [Chloroflexi bacterium]|nr:hypothetical protein [Chloroflexota bacterium]